MNEHSTDRGVTGVDRPVQIFISYSLEDVEFVGIEGKKKPLFLRALEQMFGGNCEVFVSSYNSESATWRDEVDARLASAHAIIPVVSFDLCHSPACNYEIDAILERQKNGEGVLLLPFLYRYCQPEKYSWLARATRWPPDGKVVFDGIEARADRERSIHQFCDRVERLIRGLVEDR